MKSNLNRRQLLQTGIGLATVAGAGSHRVQAGAAAQNPTTVRFPERIRVGIIGFEGHLSEILNATRSVPQVQITAIADDREEVQGRIRGNPLLQQARLYRDYRELIEREKLDIVAVFGENGPRASIIRDCASLKVPIVAEKPLALTLEELESVRSAIVSASVPLTVLLPMRFDPQYRRMRSIVTSGEIGEVVMMAAQKSYKLGSRPSWMKERAKFGGTIPYIGIHMVDLMLFVGGRDFKSVAAFHSQVGFPEMREMENNAVLAFQLDNRGTASLRLDYLRPQTAPTHGDDRLRIAGTKGIIEYQESRPLTLMTGEVSPKSVTDLPAPKMLFVDFLESIYGNTTHALSFEEIYRVNEIVLKAREAADRGQVIRL
ncbi:MAG TPA: Gfo/Idh/MocA family oxidoreductase [Acidobacteriota bacterium]|nr:Gfo/Idh/MocA family oxidoreductase [Acidobacteriota bacterium]